MIAQRLLQVTCAVCNKPVSQTITNYDVHLDSYVVVVRCHGKFDRTVFPSSLFTDGWEIVEAKAFIGPSTDLQKEVTTANDNEPIPLCQQIITQSYPREDKPTVGIWGPLVGSSL